jgi:hypothetical protein
MAKKKEHDSLFEIVVVLSIVFIVAFTGQVLVSYEAKDKVGVSQANGITGFVVSNPASASARSDFLDVSVSEIEVNPITPLVGMPFEVNVKVANEGFVASGVPFYVKLEVVSDSGAIAPTVLYAPVTKSLEPREEVSVDFRITMLTKEGALRAIATADPTSKIDDKNPSNNKSMI